MKPFVTGTHAYGPVTENSDIDIVIDHEDAVKLETTLQDLGIEMIPTSEHEVYPGFYFQLGPLTFNIIRPISFDSPERWKTITEAMRKLGPIKNKQQRIATFTALGPL